MTGAAARMSPAMGRAIGQLLAWLFIHYPAVGIPATVAVLGGGALAWWKWGS